MSKYDFSRLQKIVRKYHNLQVNKEISKKEIKLSRKNIYKELLIKDTDTAHLIILKMLFFWVSNGNLEKFANGVFTIPYAWATKPGEFLPQLIIIYRIKGNSNTGNYDIAIPHYDGNKAPNLTGYRKGSARVALVLADGSSVILNAFSESEGRRMLKQFSRYISKKYLTEDIRCTKNQRVKTDDMELVRADYYPEGRKNQQPLWRFYF